MTREQIREKQKEKEEFEQALRDRDEKYANELRDLNIQREKDQNGYDSKIKKNSDAMQILMQETQSLRQQLSDERNLRIVERFNGMFRFFYKTDQILILIFMSIQI